MEQALRHLLITDDDPDDVLIFGEEFTSRNPGISVTHLHGGLELIRYLDDCADDALPAVLLLDYKMPDFNGAQLLEWLGAHRRYDQLVKVIWSTSHISMEAESCKRLGAADYFAKPATNEDLDQLVRRMGDIVRSA